jgi:hypothetical protein
VVTISPRNPKVNAYAERRVLTVRPEVTGRMLTAGPRHLRVVLDEYPTRDHRHRPHRAPNQRPPEGDKIIMAAATGLVAARIRRRWVLGGLISEYKRAA